MSLFRVLIAVAVAIILAPSAWAQTSSTTTESNSTANSTSTYLNTDGVLPSGLIQLKTDATEGFSNVSSSDITGSENLQGCGGVTQSDYTSGLFNMPEVFDKFKKDVNTELARQILTYNYSLPQTAALFDTLNSYGNARYQQFQQSCNLDSLKQDAKNQFLKACVNKTLIDERKAAITKAQNENSGGGSSGNVKFTDDEIAAQAYAQAWEICGNQYVSNTTALQLHKDTNKAFAETLRKAEDVNASIRGVMCDASSTTASSGSASACWPMLLLPQVRLCNGESLEAGCSASSEYGVKPAPLTLLTFFDFLRYNLVEGIQQKSVQPLTEDIVNFEVSTQQSAANIASFGLMRLSIPDSFSEDANVKQFQSYLNCRTTDAIYPLKRYADALMSVATTENSTGDNERPGGSGSVSSQKIVVDDYNVDKYNEFANRLTLPESAATDKGALGALAQAAIACTVNHRIPMFDPKITATLNTMCSSADRSGFYTMAAYDVALSSTKDVYRFLLTRLKQTYGRLLNESGAGLTGTLPASSGATAQNVDSPELRRRLASAVKEIMIPEVESQLARLEELEDSRGKFAMRVQQIYTTRQGCISSSGSSAFNGGGGTTRGAGASGSW